MYAWTSLLVNRFPVLTPRGIREWMGAVTESEKISQPSASRATTSTVVGANDSRTARTPLPQLLARIALYALPALLFIRRFGILDRDIWWHLATGRWILQHHAIPHSDPFSVFGMGRPWYVYSWVFDLLMQGLYLRYGYAGIVLFEIVARVIIVVALFHLLYSLLPRFWTAAALCALSFYVMTPVIAPRPAMLTILFGIVELALLLSARRTGNTRQLWLIPPMLLLWANWHIQFVYGLLMLGVFAGDALLGSLTNKDLAAAQSPLRAYWAVLLASTLATFVNPYGPKVYETVFQYMHQPKVFNLVVELRAMDFRHPQHFLALMLALAAAMAIGWRREARPLWPLLLIIASFLAFRSVKEIWFVSVIAASALTDGWTSATAWKPPSLSLREQVLIAVAVLAVLMVGYRHYDVSNNWLDMQIAGTFPESAARYIEKHHLPGPLYNDFNDGGFLIWRLPWLPVAMDGRTNVHGDDRVAHSSAVWSGKPGWDSDPELLSANLIVAAKDSTFAALLRQNSHYMIVFEDIQTIVFQPR